MHSDDDFEELLETVDVNMIQEAQALQREAERGELGQPSEFQEEQEHYFRGLTESQKNLVLERITNLVDDEDAALAQLAAERVEEANEMLLTQALGNPNSGINSIIMSNNSNIPEVDSLRQLPNAEEAIAAQMRAAEQGQEWLLQGHIEDPQLRARRMRAQGPVNPLREQQKQEEAMEKAGRRMEGQTRQSYSETRTLYLPPGLENLSPLDVTLEKDKVLGVLGIQEGLDTVFRPYEEDDLKETGEYGETLNNILMRNRSLRHIYEDYELFGPLRRVPISQHRNILPRTGGVDYYSSGAQQAADREKAMTSYAIKQGIKSTPFETDFTEFNYPTGILIFSFFICLQFLIHISLVKNQLESLKVPEPEILLEPKERYPTDIISRDIVAKKKKVISTLMSNAEMKKLEQLMKKGQGIMGMPKDLEDRQY